MEDLNIFNAINTSSIILYIQVYAFFIVFYNIIEYSISGFRLQESNFKKTFKESLIWPLMYSYLIGVLVKLYIMKYRQYDNKQNKNNDNSKIKDNNAKT